MCFKDNNRPGRLLYSFAVVILFSILSCRNNASEINLDRKIAPAQLKQDFRFLLKKISVVNPQPFFNCRKSQIDSIAKGIEARLGDSMTVVAYYRLIRPFVSAFNDGHFSIFLPDAYYDQFKKNGGKLLPFNVAIDGTRIFVKHCYVNNSRFKIGMEVTAINGISNKKLINDMVSFISGDSFPYKMKAIEDRFQLMLWRVYGFEDKFDVTFKDGQHITATGIAASRLDLDSAKKQSAFSFNIVSNSHQKVGLLKISRLEIEKKDPFENYLKNTFGKIVNEHIKDIIIDIRGYGGGSTLLVRQLYNYITMAPYKFDSSETTIENGKIRTEIDTSLTTPLTVKDKFNGRVFLLIDPGTYSSAHMMASAFKYYKMGVIVGDSSCEKMRISGEVNELILANSKLELYCPTVSFSLQGAGNDEKRLYPDYYVVPKLIDKLYNKDVALNYCLELISGNKRLSGK